MGKSDKMFIRNDQYNFIERQVTYIINAHGTVNHKDTLDAVKLHAFAKVKELLPVMTEEQEGLLNKIFEVNDELKAKAFLSELKGDYVIPFRKVSKKTIEKLFPKAKKLQLPDLDMLDFQRLSYIGWFDSRAHKQHLVVEYQDKLKGISGELDNNSKKGFCTLCNNFSDVALFVVRVKNGPETYISRGNYICKDSIICNQKLTDLKKVELFVNHLFQ